MIKSSSNGLETTKRIKSIHSFSFTGVCLDAYCRLKFPTKKIEEIPDEKSYFKKLI